MKIIDLLRKRPTLSFEIFPPKNYDGDISSIYQTIDELSKLKPDFISVTYGAGGSTTKNTVEIASKIKNDYNIEAVAHLSCIDASPKQLIKIIDALKENKIENILSLRGDYPKDYDPKNTYHYFKYASELNEFITKNNPKARKEVGINYAVYQIIDLITNGVEGIHIYTMNRPEIAKEIIARIDNILKEFIND